MESSSDSDDESSLLRIKPEVFTESVEASEKRSSALKERKRLEARAWGAGNHESRWSKSEAKMFHLLNGRAIVYQEQPKQQCLLWDCAIILARFLESRFAEKIRGKKVIEMGCGLGLPGMVAHELGASKVMLTEMASALKSLTAQLAANKYGTDISATALHWGTEDAARRVAHHDANQDMTRLLFIGYELPLGPLITSCSPIAYMQAIPITRFISLSLSKRSPTSLL